MINTIVRFIIENRDNTRFSLACIFVVTCLVMMHLPLMGIPLSADLTQHLQFASTYQHAILTGDFFPGWAPSDNYGFGSVGIRFYPPLAYYLMAMTQMLTHNWYDTFWTNAFFWMFVGAIGMYLWSRLWLSPLESACVAIFYSFAPYHRFQIYYFILFAEFAAAGVLPFCFLTLTRVIRRGKPIDVVLFGVSFAILILTHIPTTILGTIGLAIYGLLMMDRRNFFPALGRLFVAGSLGLAASAFHWLRLVSELSWVRHTAENFTVDFYDFKQHLFPLKDKAVLFTPPINYAIILLMLSFLPLLVYVICRWKSRSEDHSEKQIAGAVLVTGLVALFLTTSLSLFIWENIGVIQKVQFPWRWMSVGYLLGSFAFVFGVSKLYENFRNANRLLVFGATILFSLTFIYFVVTTTHAMLPLDRENFAAETKDLTERRGCACWWPKWSESAAFKNKERISANARTFSIEKWDSEAREFTVDPGSPDSVRVATFYYPHWKAEVNGDEVAVDKDPDGALLIPVGGERSVIKLNFQEPQMLQWALAISLSTWLLLLILFFHFYRKNLTVNSI